MTTILLLITIVSIPLYVVRWKIFGLPTTALEVLIVISALFWVVERIFTKQTPLGLLKALKDPHLRISLVFVSSGLISVFIGSDLMSGLGIFRAYFLEPFLLFNLVYFKFINKPLLPLGALLLSGWVAAIPALAQILFGTAIFSEAMHEFTQGRVSGFYNSANSLALYLGPLISLLPLYYRQGGNYAKPAALGSGLIFTVVIFLTKSMGAFIGLGGVLVAYLLFYLLRNQRRYRQIYYKSILGGFILLGVAFFIFLINISLFTPKNGLIYPRPYNSTSVVRLCLWEGSRNLLIENPVFGSGLNSFRQVYSLYRTCDSELLQYPHNIFLNFWVETGIAGMLSFFLLIFVFYQKLVNSSLTNWLKISLLGFLVYFYLHGLFDVPYFKNDLSSEFWVYMAVGLLVIEQVREGSDS